MSHGDGFLDWEKTADCYWITAISAASQLTENVGNITASYEKPVGISPERQLFLQQPFSA